MPHFVLLHFAQPHARPIFVNLDQVTSLAEGDECTNVRFNDAIDEPNYVEVIEKPHEILAQNPITPEFFVSPAPPPDAE